MKCRRPSTKQHELRFGLKDDSIDICRIQETNFLTKDTTPSFSGICAIRADKPTNQRGGRIFISIRDYLVFQNIGETYSTPLERLTAQLQLSYRKLVTIHNEAPFRAAGITDTLDFSRLQVGHPTVMDGGLTGRPPPSSCETGTSRATVVVNN